MVEKKGQAQAEDQGFEQTFEGNPEEEGFGSAEADNNLNARTEEERVDEGIPDEATLEEKVLTLEAKLNQAENQAKEYYNHLQRLQAEFDNFRKRTQKEKEDTVKYAAEKVIGAMLPILDNFDRAMASSQSHQDFANFVQGMELILRQMQNILAKEGLTAIEALGQPFDPNLHEAVLQVDSEEHPENTVIEELQKGYYLKEKVLRPSMVKVSR